MQILMIDLGLEWFRFANKYLENLIQFSTKYGVTEIKKKTEDNGFIDEFDFIIKNIGL